MAYYLIGDSGTVRFEAYRAIVESEGVTRTNKVTSNPVEGGSPITDHAISQPIKLDIQTTITDAAAVEVLQAMWANRDLLSYRGATAMDDMLITSLQITRNKTTGAGGATVKITLQQITLASSAFVPVAGPTMAQSDKGKSSKGTANATSAPANKGLIIKDGYAAYTAGFGDPVPQNTTITAARTNPSYGGYNHVNTTR